MKLSGHTKPFAVLGHPIGHTLSPVMHNAAFQALGMDAIYAAFDVDPSCLMETLPAMANMGFAGVNLTVPLKEVAFNGLENLDESARLMGAVNTVEFTDSGLRGHNTDGKGFMLALEEAFSTTVDGRSVLILGTGGAGRAVAITCAAENAKSIMLTDIDTHRADKVASEISQINAQTKVQILPTDRNRWKKNCEEAEIIIQATPVGMKKTEESLLGSDSFHAGQMILDLIYMYPETAFMRSAREGGAQAANGLGMLLHQGAHAFLIWTGQKPPIDVMREALENEVYGQDV